MTARTLGMWEAPRSYIDISRNIIFFEAMFWNRLTSRKAKINEPKMNLVNNLENYICLKILITWEWNFIQEAYSYHAIYVWFGQLFCFEVPWIIILKIEIRISVSCFMFHYQILRKQKQQLTIILAIYIVPLWQNQYCIKHNNDNNPDIQNQMPLIFPKMENGATMK